LPADLLVSMTVMVEILLPESF